MTDAAIAKKGVASSAWRSSLAVRGRQTTLEDLKITPFPKSFKPPISSFTVHNERNWVMVGTPSPVKEGERSTILSVMDTDIFENVKQITVNGPVFDVSWRGQRLACASSKGRILYYNNLSPDSCCTVSHPKAKKKETFDLLSASKDKNKNVKRVALHPTMLNTFASLDSSILHLWNIDHPSEPTFTKQVSKHSSSEAIEWATLNPETIAVAGQKKMIKIFDIRMDSAEGDSDTSTAWAKREAHKETIRCLAWHPFIPHWISSAGDDGLIKVWDLRFGGKPVLSFEDHTNSVTRLAWSPLHSEILASGGMDRQFKIWAASVPPHYVLCTLAEDHFSNAIVGFGFRPQQESCCVASASGEIVSLAFTKTYLAPLMPSSFPKESERERDIESAVYFKDLDTAYTRLLDLWEKCRKEESKMKDLAVLLRLLHPKPLSKTIDWNSESTNPTQFQEDMRMYSYQIPPNFPKKPFNGTPPPILQEKMELLRLNCKLAVWVEKKKIQKVLQRTELDVRIRLRMNVDSFDPKLLTRIVDLFRDSDPDKAFEWGLDFAQAFGRESRWVEFLPIASVLLKPTIFDSSTPLDKEKQATVTKTLGKDTIIPQIKTYKKFLDLVKAAPEGNPSDEDVIGLTSVLDEKNRFLSYSASYTQLCLSALIRREYYDTFFIVASELSAKTKGFEFETYLYLLMKETAFPAFGMWVEKALTSKGKSKKQMHKEVLRKILNIAHNSVPITSDFGLILAEFLKGTLSSYTKVQKETYEKMAKKSQGKKAAELARETQVEIKKMLGGELQMPKTIDLNAEVKALRSFLQSSIMRLEV